MQNPEPLTFCEDFWDGFGRCSCKYCCCNNCCNDCKDCNDENCELILANFVALIACPISFPIGCLIGCGGCGDTSYWAGKWRPELCRFINKNDIKCCCDAEPCHISGFYGGYGRNLGSLCHVYNLVRCYRKIHCCRPSPAAAPLPQIMDEKSLSLKCIVCMKEERSILFSPCHHVLVCQSCANQVNTCVTCRAPIAAQTRIYL